MRYWKSLARRAAYAHKANANYGHARSDSDPLASHNSPDIRSEQRVDDSEKGLRQALHALQNELVSLRQAIAHADSTQNELRRQNNEAHAKSSDWYNRAELASKKGDTNLVSDALNHFQSFTNIAKNFQRQLDQIAGQLTTLRQKEVVLKNEIDEVKTKLESFEARARLHEEKHLPELDDGCNPQSSEKEENAFKQALENLQKELVELRQAIAHAASVQEHLAQQYSEAKAKSSEWYKRAEVASKKRDRNLAHDALKHYQSFTDKANNFQIQLDQAVNQLADLKQKEALVKSGITGFKTKLEAFKVREEKHLAGLDDGCKPLSNEKEGSILKQTLENLQEELVQLQQILAHSTSTQNHLKQQYSEAKTESSDWYNYAKLALEKGDEGLVQKALKNYQSYIDKANSFKSQLKQAMGKTATTEKDITALKIKIAKIKVNLALNHRDDDKSRLTSDIDSELAMLKAQLAEPPALEGASAVDASQNQVPVDVELGELRKKLDQI